MDSEKRFEIRRAAGERNDRLIESNRNQVIDLEPKYLIQMAHLTTPSTVWKYIEGAVTKSSANLVMLDLEDSIPRESPDLLALGRANIVRAFNELKWGPRLRFFRPRGLDLDPGHEDIATVIEQAGNNLDGLIYPKVESAEEVGSIDATLLALETELGLAPGSIRLEVLIESATAEERVFEIARASRRLVGLVFGSYDYWASLGLRASAYRHDHPLINQARGRIVKAAAAVGIPAIAEMTTNYPTRDKSDEERRAAIEEFRRDGLLARDFGFAGKWTGIPEQTALAVEIFQVSDEEIERAIEEAKLFLEAEASGRGAAMIGGRMADRATDRVNRATLKTAYALGRINERMAAEIGLI
ncbi:MAG TPA: aldolase/citrate lyase family protein [Blastocatellia bacterium]|jgi:citrate lyase subunit beta/citryl-CoA lyase|nr:aldolase/citrate lyase family protein [Blastocatellia bacterium]